MERTLSYPPEEDREELRFCGASFCRGNCPIPLFMRGNMERREKRCTPIYLILITVTLVLLGVFCMSFSSDAPYLLATTPPKSQPPIISLDYAAYKGESLINDVDQYLGMRFAKAPIGDLRFRAPQDPEQSSEVQDATKFGPICIGVGQHVKDNLAEDCLFVNVWKPANASTESNLPVWLFIQGGGYADNTNANYNGSKVVEASGHEIVFVNFNYRVGVLGFLACEEMRQSGDLNAGLLDQRKVLVWVQKYIREFGGNPDHVVIHGDSAGAGSVAHHLTAHGGDGGSSLFIGAIAESTFWPTQRTVTEMEFQYERFVEDTGCQTSISSNILSCLRSLDITTIQKYNIRKPFPGGSDSPPPLWYFLPVVDGNLIPDRLYSLFEQDKLHHVPLVVTDDTNEGTPFGYNASSTAEVAQFIKNNYPGLDENQLSEIIAAYSNIDPLPKHKLYFPAASKAYGESTFICPGNFMTKMMSKHFSPEHVWNYRFNVRDPFEASNGMGVPHVFELPSIFGLGNTNGPEYSFATINANIIPVTMNYYLSFIKTLDPNALRFPGAPVWEPWGLGTGQRLKLQTNSSEMEAVPQVQIDRCSMWATFAAAMQH